MKCVHYSKRMLRKQDCVKLRGGIAWQSFFENNFADFSYVVQVKKIKISSSRWWRFQLATSPIYWAFLSPCFRRRLFFSFSLNQDQHAVKYFTYFCKSYIFGYRKTVILL